MKSKDSLKHVAGPTKIFMTVLILLIAVGILQAIIIQMAMLWDTPSRKAPMKPKKISAEQKHLEKIRNSAKQFLPDGTIHLVHEFSDTPTVSDDEQKQQEVYDANGNLLWSGLEKNRPYEYLSWADVPSGHNRFAEWRMKQIYTITPEFSRSLQMPVRSREKTEQVWRYEPRRQLFVGYRVDDGKIGYIGSTGFTDSKSRAKPFGKFKMFTAWCPRDSFSPTLLWQTSRRIYEINFEKRQVQLIFESTEVNIKHIRLHNWRAIRPETEQDSKIPYRPLIECLTEDGKHHLIMRNPDEKLTVTVDDDWWSEALSFTATTQGIYLCRPDTERRVPSSLRKSPRLALEWLRKFRGKPFKQWIELYRVDNQSNLDLMNRYDWTFPASAWRVSVVEANPTWLKVKHYACQFSSPLYDLTWYLLGGDSRAYHYLNNYLISDFAEIVKDLRPANRILNWVLGLAMVGFAFWHGWPRQTSLGKLIFWLAFTLVFNLAGLLTYLALNHTPIIKCSSCGKSRCLGQVNCLRCGTELPAPKRRKLDLILNT
ncbi:MAG: hypothetical protein ACYSWZ_09030 [Planctomycetota bacterium]|jgi:hypothetical protein